MYIPAPNMRRERQQGHATSNQENYHAAGRQRPHSHLPVDPGIIRHGMQGAACRPRLTRPRPLFVRIIGRRVLSPTHRLTHHDHSSTDLSPQPIASLEELDCTGCNNPIADRFGFGVMFLLQPWFPGSWVSLSKICWQKKPVIRH